MIYYLVQSSTAQPELASGAVPSTLLSASEQKRFAALKTAKRRHDWLLGRWTAKRLLQEVIAQHTGARIPLDEFTIGSDAVGAPLVDRTATRNLDLVLSISHSGDCAFCATRIKEQNGRTTSGGLGVDIERIEPRSMAFVQDYFTEEEQTRLKQVPREMRDLWVTAVWSAKEATLKALRLGLTVDTRAVSCLLEPLAQPPQTWAAFEICYHKGYLKGDAPALMGWWRIWEAFVLTLVADSETTLTPGLEVLV